MTFILNVEFLLICWQSGCHVIMLDVIQLNVLAPQNSDHAKLLFFRVGSLQARWRIHNTSFYSSLMNRPNKLECYITLGMKRLAREKQSNLFGPFEVTNKIKCCEYNVWDHIHNTSFYSSLMNRPNKLECYIHWVWKGLPGRNSLTYLAHL